MTTIVIVFTLIILALITVGMSRKRNVNKPALAGSQVLYRGGIFDLPRMEAAHVKRETIDAAVRAKGLSLKEVLEVRVAADGKLIVIEDAVGIANRRNAGPLTEV
jgi:hypothetical protein